jgi:thiol-disulfide isomerase/thioredoxin
MTVIAKGAAPPPVPGVDLAGGPRALFFYKVTCPVCQMAAPVATGLETAYPGTFQGVGQDPPDRLQAFGEEYGLVIPTTPDSPPYDVSESYGIEVVPTLVLVHEGRVDRVVQSWDRDEYEGIASRLSELTGRPATSVAGDGLPAFRPG